MDHRVRSLHTDAAEFTNCTSVANSIPFAKWSCRLATGWIEARIAAIFRYREIVSDPIGQVTRLRDHLQLAVKDRQIERVVQREQKNRNYTRNQFNKGRLTRYESEMTTEEQQLCKVQLRKFLKALGYLPEKTNPVRPPRYLRQTKPHSMDASLRRGPSSG